MGQFEIKGTKSIDLIPDVIVLSVGAKIERKDVIDDEDSMTVAKEELKSSVAKIVKDLEDISKDCDISFSDLNYKKIPIILGKEPAFAIGKKNKVNYVDVEASTVIKIKFSTRDEDILVSVLKLLFNSVCIEYIYDSVDVLDLENKCLELKTDVCKKCRNDAEVIVESLGSEIVGVDKIVYNSNGNLLDSLNKEVNSHSYVSNPFECDSFDDCSFDFGLSDDEEFCESESSNDSYKKYDEVFTRGFVKTILDKKYKLEDSVTVVFSIK